MIKVKAVDSKTWIKVVNNFECRTIYHLLLDEWYKCGLINGKVYYLIFESPSISVGVPLIKQSKFVIFPVTCSSGPLIHWLGLCFSTHIPDYRKRIDLLTSIGNYLKKHFLYLKITNSPYVNDIRPFLWLNFRSHINYEYAFIGSEEIRKRQQKYKKSLRSAIKYAEKNGISVKEVSIGYNLQKWLFEHKKELSRGKQRFELSNLTKVIHLLRILEDLKLIRTYISLLPEGQIASAEVFIVDEKFEEAYRFLAFVSEIGRKKQAGSYTLDQALECLLRQNIATIHLMGGNTKELSYFISQFSPQLISYYTITSIKIRPRLIPSIY
jgi:hypothetical protein